MTADKARKWLIVSSLLITGAQMIFLIAAPSFGFPLEYPRNFNILQIVSPVFFGYLGSATHFIFMRPSPKVAVNYPLLGLLVKGPTLIYVAAMLAAFISFGYSNRVGAMPGNGMSVDNLATAISVSLALLAVTTGVIVSYLFAVNRGAAGRVDSALVQPETHSNIGAG
jgi:hypothetical protein